MPSTNAVEYRQQTKKPSAAGPFGTGATLGVGAGVQPAGPSPARTGAAIGVGGGVAQGAAPAPSAPSGGGGGGGGGGGDGTLAALAATGLTAEDWAALLAAQQGPAPNLTPSVGGYEPSTAYDPNQSYAPQAAAPGVEPPPEGSSIYSDPGFLAYIAGLDSELANTESGFRREQDETQRRFQDALPMFERNWDQNRDRLRNSFEARGLLKSGGTEDAVSRSFQQQGDERGRMESNTADAVANLEQQIAQARARAGQQRAQAALQYAGQQPVT